MRRAVATLLIVACVVALASCVAVTDPATNVGSWTARLNGHGHTDSTPATFYFEYATQRADLGTGAAKRTPTRNAPANVPNDVAFSSKVTDLEPGTTYYYRVCGRDGGSTSDACSNVQSFTTQAGVPGLKVSVGYANNEGAGPETGFPADWASSSGTRGSVTFLGDRTYVPAFDVFFWDSGGVRFDNPTDVAIKLDNVTVRIGERRYNTADDLWPAEQLVVPARGTLILASAGGKDFDTSDAVGFKVGCSGGTRSPAAEIAVTHTGVQTTFHDTTRPLTPSWPSGVLAYDCGPETHPWQRVDVVR